MELLLPTAQQLLIMFLYLVIGYLLFRHKILSASGSKELAESIIPYVKDYHVVNLGNHGPLAWGKAPNEAWFRLEDAEASAHLAVLLMQIGRVRPLNKDQLQQLFAFHHVPMTEAGTVQLIDSNANQEPAISFSEYYKEIIK